MREVRSPSVTPAAAQFRPAHALRTLENEKMKKLLVAALLTFACIAQAQDTYRNLGRPAFLGPNGAPLAGGRLYLFSSGAPMFSYDGSGGANPWPVILNDRGEPSHDIRVPANVPLRMIVKDGDATVLRIEGGAR